MTEQLVRPRTANLQSLFAPRAVAVIGASTTPGKLGATMMESLSGFPGDVVPVNPRSGPFTSIDAAVAAHPDIDLAVLCIPAAATAETIIECAAANVGAVVVCAGGFEEAGEVGRKHQADIEAAVDSTGIRLLGPNTSGFFVPGRGLFASFVPGVTTLGPGRVGVVAASGGVNHAVSFRLADMGAGVSFGVGIGGGIDVTAPDVLDHLAGDEATRCVALHLETVPDGPRLLASVRALSRVKPVVAFVVGRSEVGEFAQSHTGSLATSWATTRALLAQTGAVVVDSETELVNAATALSGRRLPANPAAGIGLITGQAGPGLIINDELLHGGVSLPRLSEDSITALSKLLPPLTFMSNPVDTGRPGPEYPQIISIVAADADIDAVGVYGITEPVVSLPEAVAQAGLDPNTPVLVGVDGPHAEVSEVRRAGGDEVPILLGPTALINGLEALSVDARTRARSDEEDSTTAVPEMNLAEGTDGRGLGSGPWHEAAAKDILDAAGVRTPRRWVLEDLSVGIDDSVLSDTSRPLAVKILDSSILHKTDIGGVHLNITTADEATEALAELAGIGASAALIEEMAPAGIDLLVGARRDPVFGVVGVLALGGVEAEVFEDSAILSLPATEAHLRALPEQLRSAPLLEGFRGGPRLDHSELSEIIAGLGRMLAANPQVHEIEINPLRLTQTGLIALDAVITPAPDHFAQSAVSLDDEEEDR